MALPGRGNAGESTRDRQVPMMQVPMMQIPMTTRSDKAGAHVAVVRFGGRDYPTGALGGPSRLARRNADQSCTGTT